MLYTTWLNTPLSERIKFATEHGVAKLRPTHTSNNRVVDDGYEISSIEPIIAPLPEDYFLEKKEESVELETKEEPKEVEALEEKTQTNDRRTEKANRGISA